MAVGAGILMQIPDEFFRATVPFALPNIGAYAAGMAFLPPNPIERAAACVGKTAGFVDHVGNRARADHVTTGELRGIGRHYRRTHRG